MYISVTSSTETYIEYSLAVQLTTSKSDEGKVQSLSAGLQEKLSPHKSYRGPDQNYDHVLLPIIGGYEGTVPTTGSQYLKICLPTESKNQSVIITLIGMTGSSAFSTYACSSEICIPDVPNTSVVGYDVSDTKLNVVVVGVSEFTNGTVFLLVTGFGGTYSNEFSLYAMLTAYL